MMDLYNKLNMLVNRVLFVAVLFCAFAVEGYTKPQVDESLERNGTIGKAYTLRDCLLEGLDNNYSLKIVKNREQISNNNATRANAGFLPSLDLASSYRGNSQNNKTKLREEGNIVKENGIFNQTIDAGVDLNWTIFEGFSVQTTYKRLKELQDQGELDTRIAVENLIADLTAEYYNYIQQRLRLKNFRYAVALSKERLRIVEQRYRIGNFSGLDYQQAKVDFNADSSDYMKQQQALHTSAVMLNELMAKENLNIPVYVVDTVIMVNKSLHLEQLMEQMLESNAALLYAKKNTAIAELDYKQKVSQSYPYLRLNAGYGYTLNKYNKGANYHRGTLGLDFGLTLGINLFDGNRQRIQRRNARINTENVMLDQADVEQSLKADLYTLWQSYENNLQIIKLEQENLTVAKDNHEIAMERYMLGNLSGIEMREAQKSLLDAEERLLTARYNTKLCEISLLQISGKISVYLQ